MKFIDEATIQVEAGKGGDGLCSFRREKYIPFGGPNGGDGGDGASVYLQVDPHLNTLVDFRHKRRFQGQNGQGGQSSNCTGQSAEDLFIPVPSGTEVYDADTDELIGDMVKVGQTLLVAQGGYHGLGNARFKSSINRAPRQTSKGSPGEQRTLRLELKVLADVGLLGMPNAGKSTFIRAISSAKPKVANYPFTTLIPNLGVVKVEPHRSFVVADIPGLIQGAAEGVGLGIQFLKHLARTKILLHVIDISPYDGSDPVENAQQLIAELQQYDEDLASKERWLVLNKLDLVQESQRQEICDAIIDNLGWQGPTHQISAINGEGTQQLCRDLMGFIENKPSRDVGTQHT